MDADREPANPSDSTASRIESRLNKARVSASSPKGIVKVVYNGHGDGLSMELKPGTKSTYSSLTMAGFVVAALKAADRAVDALHQHTMTEDAPAQWRESKPTASTDVATCFGRKG